MPVMVKSVLMVGLFTLFMTLAWYAQIMELRCSAWMVAALVIWGIALFEYMLQVPANRIGNTEMTVAQLKILQEVIALTVFVPFAIWYLKEPLNWNYFAAALCVLAAVFFVFRG